MKLGTVTKTDKRNKITSKKFDDYVTSLNCDVIVVFHFTVNLNQTGRWILDA